MYNTEDINHYSSSLPPPPPHHLPAWVCAAHCALRAALPVLRAQPQGAGQVSSRSLQICGREIGRGIEPGAELKRGQPQAQATSTVHHKRLARTCTQIVRDAVRCYGYGQSLGPDDDVHVIIMRRYVRRDATRCDAMRKAPGSLEAGSSMERPQAPSTGSSQQGIHVLEADAASRAIAAVRAAGRRWRRTSCETTYSHSVAGGRHHTRGHYPQHPPPPHPPTHLPPPSPVRPPARVCACLCALRCQCALSQDEWGVACEAHLLNV